MIKIYPPLITVNGRKVKERIKMNIKISIDSLLKDICILGDINNKIALIGNNGSGKTTILKCLAGVCMPTVGKIDYYDNVSFTYPINFFDYNKWIRYIKNNVFL